jgi:hypothetical protein
VLSVRYPKRSDLASGKVTSVMRHHARLLVSSFAALSFFSASVNAHAQDGYYPPPPPNAPPPPPPSAPPPPQSAQAPNGEYVAPLAQPTQQIYIPQSVAMSGPREIRDWDETQPIPPGYHVSTHVRTGMIVGGAVMFGALYLIDLLIWAGGQDSANSCSSYTYGGSSCGGNTFNTMWVPAVGPFLQMAQSGTSATGSVVLAVDGLAQAAGIAMFIYGIAAPRTFLVRNDLGFTTPMVVPMKLGQDGYGAGLVAHF